MKIINSSFISRYTITGFGYDKLEYDKAKYTLDSAFYTLTDLSFYSLTALTFWNLKLLKYSCYFNSDKL